MVKMTPEYQRKWRKQNPDKASEHSKRWRQKNKDKTRELMSKYRKTQKPPSRSRTYRMVEAAKARAKRLKLPFDLDWKSLEIPEFCPVFPWIKLEQGNRETQPQLDRIIPELGYVPSNVRVISGRANRIKNNASLKELEALVSYVRLHAQGNQDIGESHWTVDPNLPYVEEPDQKRYECFQSR